MLLSIQYSTDVQDIYFKNSLGYILLNRWELIHHSVRNAITNAICPVEWGEISTKQTVGKCKQINF